MARSDERAPSLLEGLTFTSWKLAGLQKTRTNARFLLLRENGDRRRTLRLWQGQGDGAFPAWLLPLKDCVQEVRLTSEGLQRSAGGWRFCTSVGLLEVSLAGQPGPPQLKRQNTTASSDEDDEDDNHTSSTEEQLAAGELSAVSARKFLTALLREDARWAHLASTLSLERVAKHTPAQRGRWLQLFYGGDPRVWYEPKLWLGDNSVAADCSAYDLCDPPDCLSPRRFARLPLVLRRAWARLLGEHGRRHLLLHFLLTNTLSVRRDACFLRSKQVSWAQVCLPAGDDEAKMCFLGTTQLLDKLRRDEGPWCELVRAGQSPRLITEQATLGQELQALWDGAHTGYGTAQCAWVRVDDQVFAPRVCFNQERQLVALLRAVRSRAIRPNCPQLTESQRAALEISLSGGVGLLAGAAGTGKTTAASAVSQTNLPVLFVAMTRNAVRNGRLRGVAGSAAPATAAIGEASALSFPTYKTHAWLCTRARGKLRPTTVPYALIVDEVSLMSPAHLLQLLLALRRLAPNIARVLLLGDDAQLPPLGYGSAVSLVRAHVPKSCAELTQVLRGDNCVAQRLAAALRASAAVDLVWLRQCLVYLPFGGDDGGPALAARLQQLHARHALPRVNLWARVQHQELAWPDWQCVAVRRSEVALVNNLCAAAAGVPTNTRALVLALKVRLECTPEALSPPHGVELDPQIADDVSRDDPRCVGYLVRLQDVTVDLVGDRAWVRGCRDLESTETPLAKGAWRVFTLWHSASSPRFVQFWSRRQHGEDGGLCLAFCLTDFCVQGSEFDDVYVLLSPTPFCPLNFHLRKLLYTSLSRCRRSCEVWIPQRTAGATWPRDPTLFWQRVQASGHDVRTITASRREGWPLAAGVSVP